MDEVSQPNTEISTAMWNSRRSPMTSQDSPAQSFEFINLTTTRPYAKDVGQRKVVRAHVAKDFSRKRKLQKLQADKLKGRKIQPLNSMQRLAEGVHHSPIRSFATMQPTSHIIDSKTTPVLPPDECLPSRKEEEPNDLLENPTPILDPHSSFFEHAFPMSDLVGVNFQALDPEPQISSIVQHVRDSGTALFPLSTLYEFNPARCKDPAGWSPDDKAAYHGIMYVTSTYANLLSGRAESSHALMHMGKVVTMVNSRLQEIGSGDGCNGVTEGLIEAVTSIALAEVC